MNRGLTRRERIRRRPEFLRVQRQGVRTRGRYATIFSLANDLDVNRLGIIATRRLGGAACRNRAKRLVREIFRLNKSRPAGPGLDMVVMPQRGFSDTPFADLQADFLATVTRMKRNRYDRSRQSPK